LLVGQILVIVLFALFVNFDYNVGPAESNATSNLVEKGFDLERYYPMYQDVHVMILIGFGFLMTFLGKHGFGSIGFNFLLTCFVIEWSILVNGWFLMLSEGFASISLNIFRLLEADFAVATILISFGAVLGKASALQLILMAVLEVVFYNINIYIGVAILKATDVGGSMFIHAFGAYFGLAVALVLYRQAHSNNKKDESTYVSDIFAMIGTLFLWLFWPSFNAGPAIGNERHRAVVNTVLSLAASSVTAFALSAAVSRKNKFNMVHIQNATLAGGVMMGASANIIIHPYVSIIIGTVAGLVSTLGYQYLQPVLLSKLNLHDTCGVHNLHGLPGVLGAIASCFVCLTVSESSHKASYFTLFIDGTGKTSTEQASTQFFALAITLGIALVSGALTGFILKLKIFDNLSDEELFDDKKLWKGLELEAKVEEQNIENIPLTESSPRVSKVQVSRSSYKIKIPGPSVNE